MEKALIRLSYRQIIDAAAQTTFEKEVFNESYNEFLLQVQAYNRDQQFSTLEEVRKANPKAASLHYKVGFSVGLFIRSLQQRIPGLTDNQDRPLLFTGHQFEIIASDISDKRAHKVAITYTTDALTLLGIAGDYLVLSTGNQLQQITQQPVQTFLVKLQAQLSIADYMSAENISGNEVRNAVNNVSFGV
ncbi:hypothetical protein [Chitinophaga pinensis]|uniref:Uncharacterized protein n=1 Tax=Chitinophaga pinensis (strain ATCC 43595 / DSM 2588 / LMG 13176 / NBRC 15968 / NCIMB 11800 / UQM 2034) TaxID=485918 RepID=A0A979G589_CHIPD|nr:hypothetical protein [Chitinophaga pinensis]ACU61104.1 hypothetical protein Cpin_3642 [Chitinophaga pinensis DSM 2588]